MSETHGHSFAHFYRRKPDEELPPRKLVDMLPARSIDLPISNWRSSDKLIQAIVSGDYFRAGECLIQRITGYLITEPVISAFVIERLTRLRLAGANRDCEQLERMIKTILQSLDGKITPRLRAELCLGLANQPLLDVAQF